MDNITSAETREESISCPGGATDRGQEESPSDRSLYFSTEFVDWILTGKKRATTRVDGHVSVEEDGSTHEEDVGDVREGTRLHALDDDERPFAVLRVTGVERRTYGSLDDEVARIENFEDRKDLCDALGRFYKDLQHDSEVVVIYFELLQSLV